MFRVLILEYRTRPRWPQIQPLEGAQDANAPRGTDFLQGADSPQGADATQGADASQGNDSPQGADVLVRPLDW
jgi:hypothetical protein